MRSLIVLAISCTFSFTTYSSFSQGKEITIAYTDNFSVEEIFDVIERQTDYTFIYRSNFFEKTPEVFLSEGKRTLKDLLNAGLSHSNVEYVLTPEGNIIFEPKRELQTKKKTPDIIEIQSLYSGTVTDENGMPLPGVNVIIKGTDKGTQTDFNGAFQIEAEEGQTLVFSFLGMETQEYILGDDDEFDIQLIVDPGGLDEIVVVAYGTVQKGESTSSIAHIDFDEMDNRALTNVGSALEGAAPGIQTVSASGQPGESPSIRIRGFGSINASNDPLYVVDGAVYTGGLSNFNMADVASISVLKDAASTALYGSRGANGVVIITTRKGNKNKETLSVRASHGFVSRAIPEYDRVNAFEYYPLMWDAFRNSLINSGESREDANQFASENIVSQLGYNPFNVGDEEVIDLDGNLNPEAQLLWPDDLDWLDEISRSGSRKEYSLSYNGGSEKSTYYGSVGYVEEEGFVINSGQEKFLARLNMTTEPLTWFKTGLNLSGTLANMNYARVAASTRIDNPFYFSRTIGPIYPVHAHDPVTGEYLLDEAGNRFYDYGNMLDLGIPFRPSAALAGKHIAEETKLNRDETDRLAFSGRTFGEFSFTEHLKLTTNLSFDITDSSINEYGNPIIGNDAPAGVSSKGSYRSTSYTFNQLLEYTRKFGLHEFSLLAGHENYDMEISYSFAERQGQIVADNFELNNFATITDATSYIDKHKIESYLSRLNYDFDDKYYISASYRRDGNSRFHADYRWDDFYSLGLAWRMDRENFLDEYDWINQMKLRASYGRVGNDAGIGYYPYQALYALGFNNASEPGIRQSALPNDRITWEGQKTLDLAVDFGFLNRIYGTFEYYHRNSDDLIFGVQLPLSFGGYFINQNIGAMVNEGLELQLNGDIISNENFNWNLGVNLSTLRNEITRMPPDQEEIISGTKKLAVGHSIYDFWLRDWKGVDPETGSGMFLAEDPEAEGTFVGENGEVLTTDFNNAQYVYSGSAIPDLFGSFSTDLIYRNFELSALLTFQEGGLVYDGTYAALMHHGTFGAALHKDALNAWKEPGDITDVPRLQNGLTNPTSNRWLTDASYLNIRNISFGYNFPTDWLERINATTAKIFVNGENLHWFSARKGMNVQQNFSGTTSNVYIPSRTVTLGLNLNF